MAADDQYVPGRVDEDTHGWAPDAPGTGEAGERAVEANRKAFEGRDTQEASRGSESNPALDVEGVGESASRSGEDLARASGTDKGREDLGTKGASDRPVGTSTAEASTGVDPQESAEPGMPNTRTGDQGG